MSKKHITERSRKLAALAVADAAKRCDFCRRALPPLGWFVVVGVHRPLRYCDEACYADAQDARRAMYGAR